MFTAKRISSTDIRMMMMFLRLRKMPTTPMVKRMAATVRYWVRPICMLRPLPRLDLDHVHSHRLGAGVLRRDGLAAHAGARPERQNDGADHGDQQHQARDLEVIDIVGIEDAPERLCVGDAGRCGTGLGGNGGRL